MQLSASHAIFLAEFLDTASGIHDFLLAGVERVALGAYLDMQILADGRTCLERVATAARDGDFLIIRMDFGLHARLSFRGCHRKGAIINESRK
jgi:hypothetical protein